MDDFIKPNLFIVGAPKCGTTTIYSFLKQHPEIFMSLVKEPHFFGNDLDKKKEVYIHKKEEYLKLFKSKKNVKYLGEASTHYLFSNSAPSEIYNFNPNSKIIIALRNPIDLIYSLHSQYVFSGNENIADFKIALDLEQNRKLGENLPPNIDLIEKVFYKSYIYKLPKQIEMFKKYFKNNVHIIILDDMKKDIKKTYISLMNFLNINNSFKPKFEIKNPNKIFRNYYIKNIIKKHGIHLGKIRNYFFNKPLGIIEIIERINSKVIKRKSMDSLLREQLKNEFNPIVMNLEKITNKDLSTWKV